MILKVQKGFLVPLPNLYHSTVPKIFSVPLKNNNSMVQKGVLVLFGTLKHVHIYFPFPLDHPLPAAVPVDAIHILQHISIVLTVFPSNIPQILMKMSPNFNFCQNKQNGFLEMLAWLLGLTYVLFKKISLIHGYRKSFLLFK